MIRRASYLVGLFVFLSTNLFAQVVPGKVKSFQREGNVVSFKCEDDLIVKMSVLKDDLIRVQMSADGTMETSMMVEWGYVKEDWPLTEFSLDKDKEYIVISTSAMTVKVSRDAFRIRVEDKEGELLMEESKTERTHVGEGNQLSIDMPADEHFFGFGFMRKTLDARGSKLTWTRGYRWKEATVPFFMSTRGYGYYSNNIWNHDFDFTTKSDGSSPDYYTIKSTSGDMDYFLFYGPTFRKILDRYTDLTGKSDLVPKWAFGLEYRFRYLGEQEEFLDIAREFRKREIPIDIMALEPGWEEEPYSMIWEWSKTRFPDGDQMIKDLDEMGFKLDLWESGIAPKENITDPAVRLDWYKQRSGMIDKGVRMFKQDDPYPRSIISTELLDPVLAMKDFKDVTLHPEQLNNVSNTLYTETLFDEFRKQTGERAVVMFHAYNASVASHRWPFQWAGDFQAAYGMLNASLSGHAMVSYDIRNPYAAGWHQGFFSPFSVVDAWAYFREPWLYSQSMEESHRLYACLRSRLVPYFYSSLWQAHTEALPIERPMVMDWSNDPNTYQLKSQFMVGDWFLLGLSDSDDAPAGEKVDFWAGAQKGNTSQVYLPEGKWIDYWTGNVLDIDKSRWVNGSWPEYAGGHLFVKAGAIIPMGQVKNFIGETEDEVMVLDIYPHQNSSYQLYEDDGKSYDYEEEYFALTNIFCQEGESSVSIDISARQGSYGNMPKRRSYLLKVHSLVNPKKIFVDGEELAMASDPSRLVFLNDQKGWYYDQDQKKIIIKLDQGWNYLMKAKGLDPVGLMPLTASGERIQWSSGASTENKDRQVEISLPDAAIPVISANMEALPADGISQAVLEVRFSNRVYESGEVNATLEGPAFFPGGKKEIKMKISKGKGSCKIISETEPGMARLSLSGAEIEDAFFELPVYGSPVSLVLEADRASAVADGTNILSVSASLLDANGNRVENASAPVILKVSGEALFEDQLQSDTLAFKNGIAQFRVQATTKPGDIGLEATFGSLKSEALKLSSAAGELQVRINPPEWIKLNSDGGWIPKHVTVFVNIIAGGKVVRNADNLVVLKVYDRNMKLLREFETRAVKGELDFKDVSYDKRPADYYFEISSEAYETVIRKVYESTWDQE